MPALAETLISADGEPGVFRGNGDDCNLQAADDLLYLNEHRYDNDGSAITVLVQAQLDGKVSEIWDIRWNVTAQQADILHIKGDDNTGSVEDTRKQVESIYADLRRRANAG